MGKKVVCWMLVFLFLFVAAGCGLFADDPPGAGDTAGEGHGGSAGNTETPEEEPEIPAGFVKESGENMFWESGDTASESGVLQNPELYIYNYAPSVMQVGKYMRYAYYCSNRPSGSELQEFAYSGVSANQQGTYYDYADELGDNRITDYIACRKGLYSGGAWYWGPKTYVLGPTPGSLTEWEQTCDPCVIAGEFTYNEEEYSYLMAYLSCATRDNNYNHICFAVANDPMGPWQKCEDINPFLRYDGPAAEYFDGDETRVPADMQITVGGEIYWGYGQPSMINTDKSSKILLLYSVIKPFYENGSWYRGTYTYAVRGDFSDLNDIRLDFEPQRMDVTGLKEYHGEVLEQAHTTTNGDYAYDGENGIFYAIFENSGGQGVYCANDKSKASSPQVGDVFRDYPMYSWTANGLRWVQASPLGEPAGKSYTSFHNNCIIRDAYGWLTDAGTIEAALTGSLTEADIDSVFAGCHPLYTYRILRKTFGA